MANVGPFSGAVCHRLCSAFCVFIPGCRETWEYFASADLEFHCNSFFYLQSTSTKYRFVLTNVQHVCVYVLLVFISGLNLRYYHDLVLCSELCFLP